MQQFATIFVLNLLTSIDNAIVIGGVARRSERLMWLGLCSAVVLTVFRTALIAGVLAIATQPGWRLALGLLVIGISLRMAYFPPPARGEPGFLRLLAVIVITDLALSIDNILSLATVSQTLWVIGTAVFVSLLPLLLLLPVIARVMGQAAWVQVLAAGFVTELGVDTFTDDKLVSRYIPPGRVEIGLRAGIALVVMGYGFWSWHRSRRKPHNVD